MPSCNKTFTITEYSGFTRSVEAFGYEALPQKTFDALEAFILANTDDGETGAVELLSLSARRSVGKVITARNYVGLITMTDGTVIEILPKISGNGISQKETKQIFLEMLKTLNDVNFKNFNVSDLWTDRPDLFEIFIKMFLDEVTVLTKQGLKSAYLTIENNEKFCKGKLLTSQDIKHNLVTKERFYVSYDDFNINRPENRLIKTTLRFLLKASNDMQNRLFATRLLTFFDGVEYSFSCDGDFSKCFPDRSMDHYERALSWCRVFLKGNSFTAFAGSHVALALLFPMEKVLKVLLLPSSASLFTKGQCRDTGHYKYSLFDSPNRALPYAPISYWNLKGIKSYSTPSGSCSRESLELRHFTVDMYQMYAYGKKYDAERVVLLYQIPKN